MLRYVMIRMQVYLFLNWTSISYVVASNKCDMLCNRCFVYYYYVYGWMPLDICVRCALYLFREFLFMFIFVYCCLSPSKKKGPVEKFHVFFLVSIGRWNFASDGFFFHKIPMYRYKKIITYLFRTK